jgi:hypothetical protein
VANQAIQKVAVDIFSLLGMPGIYDPSAAIQARLWATDKYISIAQLEEHEIC